MSHLLVIETSARGERSISRQMTRRFLERWREAEPDGVVTTRDLPTTGLTFVTAEWLQAYFTPPHLQTAEMQRALALSDALVDELLAADHVVIATPVYNYNIPSSLKAWVDHIVRKGKTLGFDGKGLVTGKRATLLMASGGVYTEGSPIRDFDFATRYLKVILGVLGITEVSVVAGGGAKAVDLGDTTMDAFLDTLDEGIEEAAGLTASRTP
jgi:FMN-dependent NADH-azoreductase